MKQVIIKRTANIDMPTWAVRYRDGRFPNEWEKHEYAGVRLGFAPNLLKSKIREIDKRLDPKMPAGTRMTIAQERAERWLHQLLEQTLSDPVAVRHFSKLSDLAQITIGKTVRDFFANR